MPLCGAAPFAAVLGSLSLTAMYVGCLYVCASHHRRNGRRAPDRDDPHVIRERFLRVGVASALAPCVALAAAALPPGGGDTHRLCASPPAPLLRWFGLQPLDAPTLLLATAAPLALTMVLFVGPLFQAWQDGELSHLSAMGDGGRLQTLRNLIVGPITEEWVFRACMCPLLHGAGFSDAACVWTSGVVFGLAHIHHVFDANVSWLAVAVQFGYTSLFGAYSSYLFLRTGLIYGPLVAHSFCNSMGLPNFGRALKERYPLGLAFVVGLGGFTALTTLDALYRPPLFRSLLWTEYG